MTTRCASSSSAVTVAPGVAAPPTGHVENLQLENPNFHRTDVRKLLKKSQTVSKSPDLKQQWLV